MVGPLRASAVEHEGAPPSSLRRYRLLLEYDGTNYVGFQRQAEGQSTVQGALEQALTAVARQAISLTAAGRTDAGVHALGQVVSFELDWQHGTAALLRALNANLPEDIAVLQVEEASPDFHPRYDARRRAYDYYVFNAPLRSPVRRLHSWWVSRPLDVERMNEAAALLVGTHDFATFGMPPQGSSTVREIFLAHWQRRREFLVFHVEANAFLYRMVRSLVGSLVAVGQCAWTVAEFEAAFRSQDRNRSAAAAPPQGLYLVSVSYDDETGLFAGE